MKVLLFHLEMEAVFTKIIDWLGNAALDNTALENLIIHITKLQIAISKQAWEFGIRKQVQ